MLSLLNKTFAEKITLKSDAIFSAVVIEKVVEQDIEIEIVGTEKIDGGISVFARAWKAGKQIGFGADGTVDIERFRIFNPPILVPDPAGPITQSFQKEDGSILTRTLREDPRAATLQVIRNIVSQVGGNGSKIIKGKVGNTVSTFFSAAGATSPVDGYVGKDDDNVWSTARGAASGNSFQVTNTLTDLRNLFGNGNGPNYFTIFRAHHLFDTSAIPDTDIINYASLSLFGGAAIIVGPNRSLYLTSGTPASNSNLALDDYSQVGTTLYGTTNPLWSTTAYNNITLNASGKSAISLTGISKFAILGYYDFNNVTPDASNYNSLGYYTADQTGTTQDPMLVVQHGASATSQLLKQDSAHYLKQDSGFYLLEDGTLSPVALPTVRVGTFSIQPATYYIDVTPIPNLLTATFSLSSSSVIIDNVVLPNLLTATFSIPTYTPDTLSVGVFPSVVTATFSIPTYTVSTGSPFDVTVTPAVQTCTFSIPTYTVVTTQSVTVTPAVQTATFSIPTASVIIAVTVVPAVQTATFTTQAPTIIIAVAVVPNVLTATFSIPAATVTTTRFITVTPNVLTATFSIPSYTVIAGGAVDVFPNLLTATFSLPAYTVSAIQNATITPSIQTATFSLPAYTVVATQFVTVTPAVQVMTFTVPSYALQLGITAAPSFLTATFSVFAYVITTTRFVTVLPAVEIALFSIPTAFIRGDFWQEKFAPNTQTFTDKVYNAGNNWTDKPLTGGNTWSDKF